ncbi:antitoxin [Actinokineospora sp. PR83]|uniref:antitoxin n=1 Tax=Actinokineospora sp. PR83 TaxID=2884908 RepID=UPI0027DF60A7|nr:Rv0909 family putative TA system antitoxin [Actinokineospora sp. PR83]MCG8914759.1 antitoxin [Actinokineospora sp. PR83]
MGIDFNELKNKAAGLLEQHGDKIEDGVEKAGEFVKGKFGHEQQVDQVVDKVQDLIPDRPQAHGTQGDQA